jgi:hypothetical protein
MKRHLPTFLLLACFAGFAFGLVALFRLRFAVGDVYPEYSSLRSDPLGTMAFYESLARMRGLSVRRDFSAADELPEGKQTAYLHLAARTLDWASLPEGSARGGTLSRRGWAAGHYVLSGNGPAASAAL